MIPLEELAGRKFKILKTLIDEGGELNISALAKRVGSNNRAVNAMLRPLMDAGLVTEKRYGRIRIIGLNEDDPRIRALRALIEIWGRNV